MGKMGGSALEKKFLTSRSRSRKKIDRLRNTAIQDAIPVPTEVCSWKYEQEKKSKCFTH
jgi:hypothetical protein